MLGLSERGLSIAFTRKTRTSFFSSFFVLQRPRECCFFSCSSKEKLLFFRTHKRTSRTSKVHQQQMVSSMIKMDNDEITDQDLIFEENVLQNPYVEDVWDKYIQFLVSTTNLSSTKLRQFTSEPSKRIQNRETCG